jgi:hypothetical protein
MWISRDRLLHDERADAGDVLLNFGCGDSPDLSSSNRYSTSQKFLFPPDQLPYFL